MLNVDFVKLEWALNSSERSLPGIYFFKQKVFGIHMLVTILKEHYQKSYFEKEQIKDLVSSASRTTVANFVNDAIKKGFFKIDISENDKRKKIIKPSDEIIDEFEQWVSYVVNQ